MGRQTRAAIAVALCALAAAGPASGAILTRAEADYLSAINRTRTAHGLPPLRVDRALVRAARAHSRHMIEHDYFAHGAFGPRLISFGVRASFLGENLAWGLGTFAAPARVIDRWLASPGHRANLLRPGFDRIGIAAPVGSFGGVDGATVITADFAGR